MKPASIKPVRCAIYTRVSTEHGLDQEFNSLDAQYDAASAYIKSQAHAGWALILSLRRWRILRRVDRERVRMIFQRYLELGAVNALVRDLRERDIRSKARLLATGATRGGVLFGRGSVFYLLRNRFYIGEVKYKDEILPGEQPAIMDRALFDAVQQKLTDQWSTRSTIRNASDHLLTGLLFDNANHRMVPTHATKTGIPYRYYVSLPLLHGESKTASVGSVSRIPAAGIEDTIIKSLKEHLIA